MDNDENIAFFFIATMIGMFVVGFAFDGPFLILFVPIVSIFLVFVLPHIIGLASNAIQDRKDKKDLKKAEQAKKMKHVEKLLSELYPETEKIIKRQIALICSRNDSNERIVINDIEDLSSHATKYTKYKGLLAS